MNLNHYVIMWPIEYLSLIVSCFLPEIPRIGLKLCISNFLISNELIYHLCYTFCYVLLPREHSETRIMLSNGWVKKKEGRRERKILRED